MRVLLAGKFELGCGLLEALLRRTPEVGVVTCATEPDEIRKALLDQLTCPVLWRPTVLAMASAGAEEFVDMGPGKVLANMIRRTLTAATVTTAEEVA